MSTEKAKGFSLLDGNVWVGFGGRGPLPQPQHPRGPVPSGCLSTSTQPDWPWHVFMHPRNAPLAPRSSTDTEFDPPMPRIRANHALACLAACFLLMLWHAWLWQEPQTFSSFVCQRRTRHTAADSSNTLCSLPASMPRQRAGKPGDSTVFISLPLRFHLRFPFPTIHRPARPRLEAELPSPVQAPPPQSLAIASSSCSDRRARPEQSWPWPPPMLASRHPGRP